jgi:hypothetical protein
MKAAYRNRAVFVLMFIVFCLGCTVSGGKGPDNPGIAVLSVSPTTLNFELKDPESSSYESTFDVKNIGKGTMYWVVTEPCVFADCDPGYGWLTDGMNRVKVLLKDKEIQSSTSGMICINSTGGTCHITVNVDLYIHIGGRVTDSKTGESVADAQISFGVPASFPTWSNTNGYYDCWVLKEAVFDTGGNATVTAVKNEYEMYTYTGKLGDSSNPPFYTHDFAMTHK